MKDFARLEVHGGQQVLAFVADHNEQDGLTLHIMRQYGLAEMHMQIGLADTDDEAEVEKIHASLETVDLEAAASGLDAQYAKLFGGGAE